MLQQCIMLQLELQSLFNNSATPYCSVVNTEVYNGIRKKEINFTSIFPIANIIVFEASTLYLESI